MKKQSHLRLISILLLAICLLLASPPVQAQTPPDTSTTRVIIALRAGASPAMISAAAPSMQAQGANLADIQPVRQFERLPGLVAEVTPAGLAALQQNPDVAAVAMDMPVYTAELPLQPAAENAIFIGADTVWRDFGLTGSGVSVAILDTGIDLNHPDFAGAVIAQQCFSQNDACPPDTGQGEGLEGMAQSGSAMDDNGHGTHVAGILAGRGQIAAPGIAPEANLVVVKVLGSNGSGYSSDVLAGIDWVVAQQSQFNIQLMNLSLGGGGYSGNCDQTDATTMLYAAALQIAGQNGITTFAASGNGNSAEEMMVPACIAEVISVGSVYHTGLSQLSWPGCVDQNILPDQVPCSSNSSPTLDLLAPGVLISSVRLGGGHISRSGTSMATPHATAAAALLLQADTGLTTAEIRTILGDSGTPVVDNRNQRLTPRLNVLAAVSQVLNIETVSIAGIVHLQGGSDHSGIEILLAEAMCDTVPASTVAAVTASDGTFAVNLTNAPTDRCLSTNRAGYLRAQTNIPANSVGNIPLATIALPGGDVTQDNKVDIQDLVFIAGYFNTAAPAADIKSDGIINILDLVVVATNYGQQGPISWPLAGEGN